VAESTARLVGSGYLYARGENDECMAKAKWKLCCNNEEMCCEIVVRSRQ